MTKYPLMMIQWEDSARPIGEWQWIADYDQPQVVECVSVGFVISKTKQAISLAPNLGGVNGDKTQASGIIRIPRSAIKKIRTISS
jgi:hypothetical protein